MPRISLDIPPGIVADDTAFAVGGAAWKDASNVRFWRGKPQLRGGWEKLTASTVSGKCRGLFQWSDNAGRTNVAFGTNTNLYVLRDATLSDITPGSPFATGREDGGGVTAYGQGSHGVGAYGIQSTKATAFPLTWSMGSWGENLVVCPRGQTIFLWTNDTGVVAQQVANAPDEIEFMLSTPQRQLMALGCNEETSGDFNPRAIRFSDIEDLTDWTTTTSNNAGEFILRSGGRIVAGRVVGKDVFIWTDQALWFGRFLGNPAQTWSFEQLGGAGLLAPHAAVVINNVAYWPSPDLQFWRCSLATKIPERLITPIARDFEDNIAIAQSDKIWGHPLGEFGEIEWFYPDARDGLENSRYVTLSTIDGTWTRGNLARTAFIDAGPSQYPIGVDTSGTIFNHEFGTNADGSNISAFVESSFQFVEEGDRAIRVNAVYPDFEDQSGTVKLEVKTRLDPRGQERTTGPLSFSSTTRKKNFRATGRLVSVKISSDDNPSFWRLGKLTFDATTGGRR